MKKIPIYLFLGLINWGVVIWGLIISSFLDVPLMKSIVYTIFGGYFLLSPIICFIAIRFIFADYRKKNYSLLHIVVGIMLNFTYLLLLFGFVYGLQYL